jgi:hypothetical protein
LMSATPDKGEVGGSSPPRPTIQIRLPMSQAAHSVYGAGDGNRTNPNDLDAWLPDRWKQAHAVRCEALEIPPLDSWKLRFTYRLQQIRMNQTKALPPVPQFNWSPMESNYAKSYGFACGSTGRVRKITSLKRVSIIFWATRWPARLVHDPPAARFDWKSLSKLEYTNDE